MSDEKQDPPSEAPPAYDSIALPKSNVNSNQDTWRSFSQQSISLPAGPAPPLPLPPPFKPPTRPATSKGTPDPSKSWFTFSSSTSSSSASSSAPSSTPSSVSSRTVNEVRTTVTGLIRNLVVGPQEQNGLSGSLSPAALGILQSCAEACTTHSISLSGILQEKFIESHSPLYWAIVKRPSHPEPHNHTPNLLDREEVAEPEDSEDSDLLGELLSRAKPLSVDTVTELRLGCLATSDQATFQRLRLLIPQFTSSISGADQILLGASLPADDITVEIGVGYEGAFAVNVKIPQFHKRMMISREISLEFIARNRLWRFSFMITPDDVWYGPPPGSWCISISLQEPSPPTWFDARFVLPNLSDDTEEVRKPRNVLRLKSKQMMEAPRNSVPATQVVVGLDESPVFGSLQYSGSPYVPADEKLTVRLEVKLRKPIPGSDECVIS
ncbi:hypothetical protein CPB84DRAFT_1777047 [Gymnopilus junonius]|uniref:Uncharacterized protein n=1 Tax=Gymnopilus junonius TaxID=109634 RepID=A0A9P5NR79_GYMJU|nr:hypothetical protein CPB84DRAFT_1777047 [Gymnopilus junonius]